MPRPVSAIETTARLTWETLDSATILCGGGAGPYIVESDEFKIDLEKAALALVDDLKRGLPGPKLPKGNVLIVPTQSGPGETRFKLFANAASLRAGTYRGSVRATAGDQARTVPVRIVVP